MSKAESKNDGDFIAAERDAKYKNWLQTKTLRDKALEFVGKVDKKRFSEEEPLREVAMAMCAVQRLMGADGGSGGGGEGNEENDLENTAAPTVCWCIYVYGFASLGVRKL